MNQANLETRIPAEQESIRVSLREQELHPDPTLDTEQRRDQLCETHEAEKGEITPQARLEAMNLVQLSIAKQRNEAINPNNPYRVELSDPRVRRYDALNEAFTGRYQNYFDDAPPSQGNQTPHDISDSSYDLLLSFTELSLRDPSLPESEAESLRIVRDTLHVERKGMKTEFDAQSEAVGRAVILVGEQEGPAMKRVARGLVGEEITRFKDVITSAQQTKDPHERFNLITDLKHGRIPIKDAEAFSQWDQDRTAALKQKEAAKSEKMGVEARAAIEAIHAQNEAPLVKVARPVAKPETVAHNPEDNTRKNEQFVQDFVRRIPGSVIEQTLNSIARESAKTGVQLDVSELSQKFNQFVTSESSGVDPRVMLSFARGIGSMKLHTDNGDVWKVRPGTSEASQRAAQARKLVTQLTRTILKAGS